MSSLDLELSSERVCYVQCNFCNTILAVSVPCSSSTATATLSIVTVRCGHCANLLSVNMAASLHHQQQKQKSFDDDQLGGGGGGGTATSSSSGSGGSSSSNYSSTPPPSHHHHPPPIAADFHSQEQQPARITPIRPPEKRHRVPSAYNRFIKEEIQRIKASNPEISHREAFSTAAKNWAHFPHIHFGLKLEGNKQAAKMDHAS